MTDKETATPKEVPASVEEGGDCSVTKKPRKRPRRPTRAEAKSVNNAMLLREQIAQMDAARAQEAAQQINAILQKFNCAIVPRIVWTGDTVTESTVVIRAKPPPQQDPNETTAEQGET